VDELDVLAPLGVGVAVGAAVWTHVVYVILAQFGCSSSTSLFLGNLFRHGLLLGARLIGIRFEQLIPNLYAIRFLPKVIILSEALLPQQLLGARLSNPCLPPRRIVTLPHHGHDFIAMDHAKMNHKILPLKDITIKEGLNRILITVPVFVLPFADVALGAPEGQVRELMLKQVFPAVHGNPLVALPAPLIELVQRRKVQAT